MNLIAIYKVSWAVRWQLIVPYESAIRGSEIFQEKVVPASCNTGMVAANPGIGEADVIVVTASDGRYITQLKQFFGLTVLVYCKKCHVGPAHIKCRWRLKGKSSS